MLLTQILPRLQGSRARLLFTASDGREEEYVFEELGRDVTVLAQRLREIGATPGMRIGLLAPSCYRWIVWDLAILTIGCISVALLEDSQSQDVDRLSDQLALCLLAVDPALVQTKTLAQTHVLPFSGDEWSSKRARVVAPELADDPLAHSLAFSSGTTGKTKGLIISRNGTEHLLNLYEAAFGVAESERFLTFLPFANYQQRMAYYFCLYHGVDFVYVPYQRMFAGLKRYRPTYIIAPPIFYDAAHAMTLAGIPDDAVQRKERLSARLSELLGGNIRYLITGMAPIKRNTLDFFWEHGMTLYEAFGITEAGMVCWNRPGQVKLGSVGQPAEAGSVSLNEDGEVIVTRDALLTLGYFDASVEDQHSTFVGPCAVATGDIAERDEGGFYTIIGRKKDAIITKAGEKFHPEPIESDIQAETGVKSVVVLGGEPLPVVTAWIVVPDKANPEVTDRIRTLVAQINDKLPQSQRVRQVVFTEQDFTIESGMRTRNMKLNRRAILQQFVATHVAGGSHA